MMLDLKTALKKLSFGQLRMRWSEYNQLPIHDQQALMTYAVIAVLLVGTLILASVGFHIHRTQTGLSDSDRLGMIILADRASRK